MSHLIIGATGKSGEAVVRQLAGSGLPVRAAGRDAEKVRRHFGALPVEPVAFDFGEAGSYARALADVSHVFFIAPPNATDSGPVERFLAEAVRSGVQHLTFHSGRTTGDIAGRPLNNIEKLVAASGLSYTILRPGWFMQNFGTWFLHDLRDEGKLYLPAGRSKSAFVDVRDTAAVVERTFTEPIHDGHTYELTSDQALDHYEVAALFTRILHRKIEYVELSPEEYIARELAQGHSESAARFTVGLYEIVRTGKEAHISPDIPNILGRPPIRLEQYIEDFADLWER